MFTTFTPDSLLVGAYPTMTDSRTLISGQNLTRGAVLGVITASGKLTLSLAAASDGSQVPHSILAKDVDATDGDTVCPIYVSGAFNISALTLGTGHTADAIKETLRDKNIYLVAGSY